MANELLIRKVKGRSFNEFVADLLALIRCDQWEQVQKPGETSHSFRSFMLGIEISLNLIEDARFENYIFCVQFAPEVPHRGEKLSFDGLCDSVARKLAFADYDILRPINREISSDAIRYQKNPERDNRPGKQVVTEEVQGMPSRQFTFNLSSKAG